MKYKPLDKVRIKSLDWYNENKDEYGYINCGSRAFFTKMSDWCGKILTIRLVVEEFEYYCVSECIFSFTDEMIEGLVEEETSQNAKLVSERFSEYVNPSEFKYAQDTITKMLLQGANIPNEYILKDENGNVINATKIVLEKLIVPKFKKGDKIKDKNNRVWYVVSVGNRHFDISSVPDGIGYFVPMEDQDDYKLFPDRELPKTYGECCKILGLNDLINMYLSFMDEDTKIIASTNYHAKTLILLNCLTKLFICRDTYWKIAGEKMGLGKPWEPDWKDDTTKYILVCINNSIEKDWELHINHSLSFPTKEMRDAFYENFKSEIEICKELL